MNKIRIAYIAWTEPGTVSGATLAIKRHLFEGGEFEVLVCNDKPYRGVGPEENWIHFSRLWIHHRLSRTRLRRWISQYEMLVEPYLAAARFLPAVRKFRPAVILTIPDNTLSWAALLIAQKLHLPLVSNFQDWWPRGQFFASGEAPYTPTRAVLESRFLRFYKFSRVAFCTSEGFKKLLGLHPYAPVLYPCPAPRPKERPIISPPNAYRPLRIVYGGTLVRYYGEMMLSLAKALQGNPNFELKLFGAKPDWSEADLKWAFSTGVYGGQLTQVDFRKELSAGDAFITAMSNCPELETMMKTSFTTKFLEYCQFAKPVLVWGPEYCQPIQVALVHGAGLTVTSMNPSSVIDALNVLRTPEKYQFYADAAWRAATSFFDPESIHKVFLQGVNHAVKTATIK
jgi:hypothetical protein